MHKRKSLFLLLLALVLLLWGCGKTSVPEATVPEETIPVPAATVPADGDPYGITCKGSYSAGTFDPQGIVSRSGDRSLTNEELQVWYAMAVASRRQADTLSAAPDFTQPLDTQPCPLDDSVNSWEQYFLKQALNTWHSVCALEIHSREHMLPTEEAYQPNMVNHRTYVTDMPASKVLYGYNLRYQPNSMHQSYLDTLPETLDTLAGELGYGSLTQMAEAMGVSAEAVTEAVRQLNYSYMYFTTLSYETDVTEEELTAAATGTSGRCVDIRQILLVPGEEGDGMVTVAQDGTVTCADLYWEECASDAEQLLKHWSKKTKHDEAAFADLAYKNSEDPGSARDGGAFRRIRQGQLAPELDAWCFDAARQPGDTEILRSPYGYHILYFSGARETALVQAEDTLKAAKLLELTAQSRSKHPASVNYSAITLTPGEAPFSTSQALYPDIAHERFPEVPLYLQQDYPKTMYGAFKITTNGCGITSMAMLASYLADDALTPPVMCERYGRYSHRNGTDGMIFTYEPSAMGFYLREKTYDPRVAKAALEEGQIVISVQHPGYWTRGGHYIVLEAIDENGIQVRDSNIYNFNRVPAHRQDRHTWGSITASGSGYWIYEDKVTRIPMCSRCGDPESRSPVLQEDYICGKCTPALLRRNTYLSLDTLA